MPPKEILLTPGPTQVPERIFDAMRRPTLHHRTPQFEEYLAAARKGIKQLTRSENDPIFLAGSGTAAMEAALVNLCRPGEKVLVLNAGKFGERWRKISERLGLETTELIAPCGESVSEAEVIAQLEKSPSIKAVCMQYCETSTTVEVPVRKLCQAIKSVNPDIFTVVDAVSAIATTAIYLNELNIDILVSAAHKGLMLPPGLAMLNLNSRSWEEIEKIEPRSLYFDLKLERKAAGKSTTAWTPAMNHIVALSEALKMISEEREENVYQRHLALSRQALSFFKKLGLKPMTERFASSAVSGVYTPQGIDAEKIRAAILREHGVQLAGGQDELKGKVLRFGHMGACSADNLQAGLNALEDILNKQNAA